MKNATVFKQREMKVQALNRNDNPYFIVSDVNEAVLLPEDKRKKSISNGKSKKGRPGQSNTFYLYDDKGRYRNDEWIDEALTYIRKYNGENLLCEKSEIDIIDATNKFVEEYETLSIEKTSQGLLIDSKMRKSIELYSMNKAKEYFLRHGFEVIDVSKNNSYDLCLKKNEEEYYVEVKGTGSSGKKIFLTPNEVEFNKNHKDKMILYILHSIEFENKIPKGGVEYIQKTWIIEECDLRIPLYQYTVCI